MTKYLREPCANVHQLIDNGLQFHGLVGLIPGKGRGVGNGTNEASEEHHGQICLSDACKYLRKGN